MIHKATVDIYKRLVPRLLRDKVTMLRNAGGLNTIRKNILAYYKSSPEADSDEIKLVLKYLKTNPLTLFPYHFPEKYKASAITVYQDTKNGLRYVLHDGKRLYFKRSWTEETIKENYNNLLIEQDACSPHRYLSGDFGVEKNDVVADIGAAEGIFSLPIINHIKKLYLFETDGEWVEALEATFRPWAGKVEIVNRFVSGINDAHNITLDEFTATRGICFDFIKIDVDGAEGCLLQGSAGVLAAAKKLRIAICTYHKAADEADFTRLFMDHGFTAVPSGGYMIFYYDPHLAPPYLRRGLLKASK